MKIHDVVCLLCEECIGFLYFVTCVHCNINLSRKLGECQAAAPNDAPVVPPMDVNKSYMVK